MLCVGIRLDTLQPSTFVKAFIVAIFQAMHKIWKHGFKITVVGRLMDFSSATTSTLVADDDELQVTEWRHTLITQYGNVCGRGHGIKLSLALLLNP